MQLEEKTGLHYTAYIGILAVYLNENVSLQLKYENKKLRHQTENLLHGMTPTEEIFNSQKKEK